MTEPGPVTDIRSSLPSGESSALRSPRSALGEVAAQASGTAVSLFCASKAANLLTCACDPPAPGPLGIPRWCWGLLALILIAVPTSVRQVERLVKAVRGNR